MSPIGYIFGTGAKANPHPKTLNLMLHKISLVYTVGFTEKNSPDFFELLRRVGVRRILDVRLHPIHNWRAFAKQAHLPYFLKQIFGVEYIHLPILAPTPALFNAYKREGGSWENTHRHFSASWRSAESKKNSTHRFLMTGVCCAASTSPTTVTAASWRNTCNVSGANWKSAIWADQTPHKHNRNKIQNERYYEDSKYEHSSITSIRIRLAT